MCTGKKIFCVFYILLAILCSLSAETTVLAQDQVTGFSISCYTFTIKGKTKEFAIRNVIVPKDGDPVFPTEAALVKALDGKKQKLINKRIFTSISYTYAFESYAQGIASYTVHFFIEDAFTLLPIPYGKFDNDTTGLRFGMKLYDKNLFGTFANLYMVGHVSQGNGGLDGWTKRQDSFEMTVTSLPLGSSMISLTTKYSNTINDNSDGTASFDLNWTNLKLFGIPFSISPAATFRPSADFSSWNPSTIELVTNFGPFKQDEALYSLYNQTKYTYSSETLYILTYLRQHKLTVFTHPIDFRLSGESSTVVDAENISYLNLGATLGTRFALPLRLSLYSSIGAFLHIIPNKTPLKYSYLFSSQLTRSRINWKGNFRTGSSLSLAYTTDMYPQVEYESSQYWQLEGHSTWFLFATKRFNPSIRFTGYIAGTKRPFLPSDSGQVMADYFRGILQSNPLLKANSDTHTRAAVANVNLSMLFIDLKGFAETFVSPFVDIGVVNDPDNIDKTLLFASAGMEGYVIFDKFPSYPIRGSLGFNLGDVKKAFEKEISMNEVEFEIAICMDLFF